MADNVKVSIVRADGSIPPEPESFKPGKLCGSIIKTLEKSFGPGKLLDKDGDTVTLDKLVAAGAYKYKVTGELTNVYRCEMAC